MELKKTLGLFDAMTIGIGAIIGAGIFVVTGIAAGLAGPALLLSLLISACISAFTALSFAELAAFIPKEGGGYEFAHELVSPFAMARNNDLPQFFVKLHPARAVPYNAILVFGLIMAILAAFTDLMRAAAISNFASLLYYAVVNYSALKLEKPVYPRIIPVLGLITSVILLFFLTKDAWIMGGAIFLAGVLYYYTGKYGRFAKSQ